MLLFSQSTDKLFVVCSHHSNADFLHMCFMKHTNPPKSYVFLAFGRMLQNVFEVVMFRGCFDVTCKGASLKCSLVT